MGTWLSDSLLFLNNNDAELCDLWVSIIQTEVRYDTDICHLGSDLNRYAIIITQSLPNVGFCYDQSCPDDVNSV